MQLRRPISQLEVQGIKESLFNDQQLIALKDILSRLYNVSLIGFYSDGTPIYKNEEQIQHIKSEIESRTKIIIESQGESCMFTFWSDTIFY